jgi:diguanylate cyclase (GGDEF)-like protein
MPIPALTVALLSTFALPPIGLACAQPALRQRPELGLWTRGSWSLLIGLVTLASGALLPEWFFIVLGNGLVLLALLYFSRAVYRFMVDEDAPRWQWHLALAGEIALVLIASSPIASRSGVISAVFAAQLLPPAMLIARRGWHAERSLRTVAVMFGFAMALLGLRAVRSWTYPGGHAGFFDASLGDGLTFLLPFVLLLGSGFAFVLAIVERVGSRMKELSTHDGLTGCVNRVYFDAILNHVLERGRRERTPVSLLLMDLDHFKQVNDEHGHRTGDDLLRRFAQTVRARSRKSDVFGRLGGEEFGLILPVTDLPGALHLAEQVRAAVEVMPERALDGEKISLTVSLGGATAVPRDDLSGNRLYAEAEEALGEAKRLGTNRVVHYDAELKARIKVA